MILNSLVCYIFCWIHILEIRITWNSYRRNRQKRGLGSIGPYENAYFDGIGREHKLKANFFSNIMCWFFFANCLNRSGPWRKLTHFFMLKITFTCWGVIYLVCDYSSIFWHYTVFLWCSLHTCIFKEFNSIVVQWTYT